MRSLVTGTAGFIGSHVASRLLDMGHEVTGVDVFTDYYPRWIKERNLARLSGRSGFHFLEADLETLALPEILPGFEAVFHLAAQAGVRASWGQSFSEYIKNNIQATQKLLEACLGLPDLRRFVYASSSSVYGLTSDLPMKETSPVRPLSPYGVTKLSAEQLCFLYFKNFGVPTVSLRFFTVYGPGQRPDMAFHKFFKALGQGEAIPVFGDGSQTRDFTYIDDIVAANLAAVERGRPGETYNIGGGHRETLADVIALLEEICGKKARLDRQAVQKGDVPDTWADIGKAGRELGYAPATDLRRGLEQEWKWIRGLYDF